MTSIRHIAESPLVAGAILIGLLGIEHWAPLLPDRGAGKFLRDGIAEARGRNPLWWTDLRGANNGYYEQLMSGAEDPAATVTPISLLFESAKPCAGSLINPYVSGSFLLYEPKPNLNSMSKEGPVVSNSHGFFDREYAVKKPAGVRRIALMGDSIARGWGVTMDQRFSTLLADRLNAEAPAGPGTRFEILSFAVAGYRISQMFDVALEEASLFQPDVYMISITQLTVAPDWGIHLAQLVDRGIDLKYDFFRQAIKDAGIRKGDPPAVSQWKLAPYRVPVLREALLRLKAHAERHSAQLVILLVPATEDKSVLAHRFRGASQLAGEIGVPVVNAIGAFDGVENIEAVRNDWYDAHPNAEGHRLLAEELYRQLRHEPAWSAVTGQPLQLAAHR